VEDLTTRRTATNAAVTERGSDDGTFAEWVRPHWDVMARLAARLSAPDDWEDVLQEALSAAWRKRTQFDAQRGTPRNWLLAITADQARKRHRRLALTRYVPLEDSATAELDDTADIDLERALVRLTQRQRTAITLYYHLALPIADVAAVMSCSTGTVKSTLADARARLRDELGEDYR
jgi:RNA polymerase sigma factor (sigma-70 family)